MKAIQYSRLVSFPVLNLFNPISLNYISQKKKKGGDLLVISVLGTSMLLHQLLRLL